MLSASAAFAATDDVALSEAAGDIAIEENVLTDVDDSASVLADDSSSVNVTTDNFFDYFDDEGTLRDNVTDNELVFSGDFSEIGVNYISIGHSIKLTGNDAVFDGATFVVMANDVTIDGLTIVQSADVSAITIFGASGVVISNNFIDYTALEGCDSYGILAQLVEDLSVINNTMYYVGNTNGTVVNNAVLVSGDDKGYYPATDITFEGNTFEISLPSADVDYDWTTYEPTVYSEGIVFYYVEDVSFVGNTVEIIYNNVTSASGYDSLYAVSAKGNPYIYDFDDDDELIYPVVSKNVVISDNTINIGGYSCVYGIFAGAEGLTINGNDITVTSENYLAHGIDVDSNAEDVMVAENTIVAEAPIATYGICADGYMGPVSDSKYIHNDITVTGYSSIGIKVVVDPSPVIAENTVTAEGNYTYGIIANANGNGVIADNIVYALGSNTGSDPTGDSYMQKNSVGLSVKGNNEITGNEIYSTNIGLNIVQKGGMTVEDNTIVVENNALIDSYGIYAKGVDDLAFRNNTIAYVGYSNGTIVNNAVRISGDDKKYVPAKNITFEGNTFDISIPSADVVYDWTTYEPTVYSEGIVFYYVEDVSFVGNTVDIIYNNVTSASGYDSLYAVSAKGNAYIYDFDDDDELIYPVVSKNVVISDNTINIGGYSCVYGIFAGAEGLTINGNDISVSSVTYLAHGIDVDSNAVDVMVAGNTIVAEAPLATYGICADGYMGPVSDSKYIGNNVTVAGYSSIGIKVVVDPSPVIAENTVTAEGNYTYGIIANANGNGVIADNIVYALGSNTGSDPTGDSYMQKNSVGLSVKGNNEITGNEIYSTNIGLNIVQKGGMTVEDNTIVVENNALIDSYGIYAKGVDDLAFRNNTIAYVGYSNGTIVNNAVRISGDDKKLVPAKNITFEGNTFDISIPSADVVYDWTTYEPTVYSEGIVFYYVEDVSFVGNTVDIIYNDVTSASGYDSLYAVSAKGNAYIYDFDDDYNLIYPVTSKNVVISDNTINIGGYSCVYGIFAGAEGLTINGNDISVSSVTYLAHGIDVDSNAVDVMVAGNTIVAEAPLATYGICADGYMGPINRTQYFNNDITVTGYSSIGIKVVVDPSPVISENTVTANGNYTYGIIANANENGVIADNIVYALGSNIGSDPTGDSYMQKNSVGLSVKGNNVISGNEIYSTNIGLNIVQEGGMTIDHNTIVVENNALIDSYGIYANGVDDLAFTNNTITYVGYSNGTNINNAVRIEGNDKGKTPVASKNIQFVDNEFCISLPSCDLIYDWTTYQSTVVSEGIVFYFCQGVEFVGNVVDIVYNDVTTTSTYDSIYGVSVRSDAYSRGKVQSSGITIGLNNITLNGYGCAYPVYVCANDFAVIENNIVSTSEVYLAHGIDVDGPSATGLVAGNIIVAESPLAAYGIYSYQYMGAIKDISYVGNDIQVTSYASAGMETVERNPTILQNTIVAEGNYTYGIIASIRVGEGVIEGNNVTALGSNVGSDATGDPLMPKNSMGISVKGDAEISNNIVSTSGLGFNLVEDGDIVLDSNVVTVISAGDVDNAAAIVVNGVDEVEITNNNVTTSTDYAVSITKSTGTVHDNYLVAADLCGSSSVLTDGDVTVYNNLPACDAIVIAEPVVAVYNDGSYLVATLTDVTGNPAIGAKLKFAVSGKSAKYIRTDENGQAALSLANYEVGTYRATITHVADDYYNKASTTAGITIVDVMPVDLVADDLTTEYNSGENITATLTDANGDPVIGASIVVKFNGETSTLITDENGEISISTDGVPTGEYTVVIVFTGDSYYDYAIATSELVIVPADTVVTAEDVNVTVGGADYLVATLTDADGNAIADAKLKFAVSGKSAKYIRTDANGQAALSLANYDVGTYTATITFVATDLYNKASTTAVITVLPKKETSFVVSDLETAYSSGDNLTATLVDENGEAIAGAEVLVQFNGENSTVLTDEFGQVSVSTDGLVPGDYGVSFTYAGDDTYVGSEASANIAVDKMDTNLAAENVVAFYKDGSYLVATLTDANGNAIADAKLKFAVSGKSAKYIRTDANGQAALNLINYDVGTYRATITFVATDLYNKSSTTANIVIEAPE